MESTLINWQFKCFSVD